MEPVFDLDIHLPPNGSRALLRDVHRQLRAAILDGRLRPGLRLPATRRLAASLGVSRNTVLAAYDLLLAEGYVSTRPGSGSVIAALAARSRRPAKATPSMGEDRRLAAPWRGVRGPRPSPHEGSFRFDFRLGVPDAALFPFAVWRRLNARAWRALSKAPATYDRPEGRPALREAIAHHVSFSRAIACAAEDVIVTAGAQQGFDLLARVLVTPGRTVVAVEDPGYPVLRDAFSAAGARIEPVPVDDEGLIVERLPEEARVVCITPSHQFPLGVVMSARRRAMLLAFAQARGAVVIEDDYDSEFRFGGRPLDALRTLDGSGVVFYVGTFSKTLFPALRLGFIVTPEWARAALGAARQCCDWHGAPAAQNALAAFIAEGHLARHIRKMRRVYAERRTVLLRALADHCDGALSAIPAEAGLHLAAKLAMAGPAEAIAAHARAAGIAVDALRRYALVRPGTEGLAFGYGNVAARDIAPAIRRLAAIAEWR